MAASSWHFETDGIRIFCLSLCFLFVFLLCACVCGVLWGMGERRWSLKPAIRGSY